MLVLQILDNCSPVLVLVKVCTGTQRCRPYEPHPRVKALSLPAPHQVLDVAVLAPTQIHSGLVNLHVHSRLLRLCMGMGMSSVVDYGSVSFLLGLILESDWLS